MPPTSAVFVEMELVAGYSRSARPSDVLALMMHWGLWDESKCQAVWFT